MLTFDVETMPKYHPNAIMACAASENAWYAWISPWLLDQTQDPQQLIPLGNPDVPKVVVGHNVSYDRGRLLEEYSLEPTKTRFLDTMALHVAVKGISSNQRPAWMQYRKLKREAEEQREETVEAVVEMIQEVEERHSKEEDTAKREELKRLRQEMEDSLPTLQGNDNGDIDATETEVSAKRWEDLTSANSLADVAKLHCNIVMDKEARNDFMTCTPDEIRENITDYLTYCATDVYVTHCVYVQALPAFLTACPHPVSFAGILTMGSSFLTVNEEWEKYLANAEGVYRDLEEKIKLKLKQLAEQAKAMMVPVGSTEKEKWRDDVWLSQLDWTPKAVGKSRGLLVQEVITSIVPALPCSSFLHRMMWLKYCRRLKQYRPRQSKTYIPNPRRHHPCSFPPGTPAFCQILSEHEATSVSSLYYCVFRTMDIQSNSLRRKNGIFTARSRVARLSLTDLIPLRSRGSR